MNRKETLLLAYEKGYRCINGIVYNPDGRILYGSIDRGYKFFRPFKTGGKVMFHRLVAYQKYGDGLFEEDIEVRHKDNNSLNNLEENILIGTHSQNMQDIPPAMRSWMAGANNKKYNYKEVKTYYNKCRSYKKTMRKFGITSKGTLHHILKTL